MIHTAGNR